MAEFEQKTAEGTQYAAITVKLEPVTGSGGEPGGDGVEIVNTLRKGQLTNEQVHLVGEAVQSVADGGGFVGYPLTKVKITIESVEVREGETTDSALEAAANKAVRQALDAAGPVLLEPIMELEITTPEEFLGNIQGDLNSRRATITSSEDRDDVFAMRAEVALSQMFGYSTQIRSLSKGRAGYSMTPLRYAEAPKEVLDEMLM